MERTAGSTKFALGSTMPSFALKNIDGTINLVNPGVISHEEILQMYREIIDPNHVWTCVPFESLVHLKSERSNNAMSASKLCNMYPHIMDIKSSIRNILMRRAGKA